MCVFYNATSQFNVFFKWEFGTVDHNGGEAAVNTGFADLEVFAVVEVETNVKTRIFHCSFNEFHQVDVFCIFACTCRYLQNKRRFFYLNSFDDTLDDLNVVYVEGTDCILAFVGFLEHFFRSD